MRRFGGNAEPLEESFLCVLKGVRVGRAGRDRLEL